MLREQIAKELQEAESKCLSAISYVGAANYPEREKEAELQAIKAFNKLRNLIQSLNLVQLAENQKFPYVVPDQLGERAQRGMWNEGFRRIKK